jgi:hypothetical protein
MKHTNVNITSPKGMMKYYIEYVDNVENITNDKKYTLSEDGSIDFVDGDHSIYRQVNEWEEREVVGGVNDYLPKTYDRSSLSIYFPRFSVETYEKGVQYALTVNTWIHGHMIYLCNRIIDRNDVVAADGVKKFANQDYYECLSVDIIDPYEMVYGDAWRNFRQKVCGEKRMIVNSAILPARLPFFLGWDLLMEDYFANNSVVPCITPFVLGLRDALDRFNPSILTAETPFVLGLEDGDIIREINNTGSVLNISLHPVRKGEDGIYREIDQYHGGQNSINISDEVQDYLSFNIKDNRDEVSYYEDRLKFNMYPVFNQNYEQNTKGFRKYIQETYLLAGYVMKLEVIVQDDDNIYKAIEKTIDNPWQEIYREDLLFDSWEGFHDGMYIRSFLKLYLSEDREDAFIYLSSNRILLTQELFKYLVGENPINKVYLEALDMNNYTINAVNKIQHNIIQLDRPSDYKANIIKPIFFRSRELAKLIVHPAVTEYVCINLDQYKSKVDAFMLKIEDTIFVEYGRNPSGIVFKIVGNNLPNKITSGVYYVLNQDEELVTTGQYIYEQ